MRISDWSSDVCSSDLSADRFSPGDEQRPARRCRLRTRIQAWPGGRPLCRRIADRPARPGRASLLSGLEGRDGEAGSALTGGIRSEEHTSELQSLMRISYAVFCLKKKKQTHITRHTA